MAGPIFWSADKIGNQHRQVLALIPYNALIYNENTVGQDRQNYHNGSGWLRAAHGSLAANLGYPYLLRISLFNLGYP
jgi:hypothetical protein